MPKIAGIRGKFARGVDLRIRGGLRGWCAGGSAQGARARALGADVADVESRLVCVGFLRVPLTRRPIPPARRDPRTVSRVSMFSCSRARTLIESLTCLEGGWPSASPSDMTASFKPDFRARASLGPGSCSGVPASATASFAASVTISNRLRGGSPKRRPRAVTVRAQDELGSQHARHRVASSSGKSAGRRPGPAGQRA